jgi:hypothetical protein
MGDPRPHANALREDTTVSFDTSRGQMAAMGIVELGHPVVAVPPTPDAATTPPDQADPAIRNAALGVVPDPTED